MSNIKALEGQWYRDRVTHDQFCVIAVVEDDHWIDVRDEYGEIDELDFEEWESMDLEMCAAPVDWTLNRDDHFDEDDARP